LALRDQFHFFLNSKSVLLFELLPKEK